MSRHILTAHQILEHGIHGNGDIEFARYLEVSKIPVDDTCLVPKMGKPACGIFRHLF